jgi:predicted transcriptional regulator
MLDKHTSNSVVGTTDNAAHEQSAPAWVFTATDRAGSGLSSSACFVLLFLWTSRGSAQTVQSIAERLRRTVRPIERQLAALTDAGLVARSCDGVFVLAHPDARFEADARRGFLYAIEFSDGTVKVGRSSDPDSRLSAHRSAAAGFGLSETRRWVSVEIAGVVPLELAVLDRLRVVVPCRGGEWFSGGWDVAVVTLAEMTGGLS